MEKITLSIHFEDRSGNEFERLTFAYVSKQKDWESIEWFGQTGKDGGRDIWGKFKNETYCYQCANYAKLTFKKAKEDIDKLYVNKTIPNNSILVCGGKVTAELKKKIIIYANSSGINNQLIWSGVEFEELIRKNSPEILKRFVEGISFPETSSELIKFAQNVDEKNDNDIIDLIIECFDRPAFTTKFKEESNIPNFEKAIESTIEVLNTGIHRLRDGTIIRTIPSRHRISDEKLKAELAEITKLVISLRDNFLNLLKTKEIKKCGCNELDCPVYFSTEKAEKIMDESRKNIFEKLKIIKPNFKLLI